MAEILGIIGLILGLAALIYLKCVRQINALMSSFVAIIIIIIFNRLPIWETITNSYAAAIGEWLKDFLVIFTLGTILGKSLQITGCAQSMGNFLIRKLGVKHVGVIIHLLSFLLVFSGVDAAIAILSIAPISIAMVKKANLPRRFAIACYLSGGCSYVFALPGSASVNNLIPAEAFGTTTLAAWMSGLIGSALSLVCVLIYQKILEGRLRKKNIGFDLPDEMVREYFGCQDEGDLCPPWIGFVSLVFVALCAVCLGGTGIIAPKAAISLGLIISTAFTLISGYKFIRGSKIMPTLEAGVTDGMICSVLTGTMMGFVAVVQKTSCFMTFANWAMNIKVPTLLGVAIAMYLMNIVLANSPGTLNVFIDNFSARFLAGGVQPAVLHRVIALSSVSFAAQMPHNPSSIILTRTFKHSYMSSFADVCIICILCPMVGTFATIAVIYLGVI